MEHYVPEILDWQLYQRSIWTELFEIEFLICLKMDLALDYLERLKCYKTQLTII